MFLFFVIMFLNVFNAFCRYAFNCDDLFALGLIQALSIK